MKKIRIRTQIYMLVLMATVVVSLTAAFYMVSFSEVMERRSVEYAKSSMLQTVSKINDTLVQLKTAGEVIALSPYVKPVLTEESPAVLMTDVQTMRNMMTYVTSGNKIFDNISLVRKNGGSVSLAAVEINIIEQIIHQYDPVSTQYTGFTEVVRSQRDQIFYYAYIQPVYEEAFYMPDEPCIGSCVTLFQARSFSNAFKGYDIDSDTHYYLIDAQNIVVAAIPGRTVNIGQELDSVIAEQFVYPSGSAIELDGGQYFIQYENVQSADWKVVSLIPVNFDDRDMINMRNLGLAFLLLTGLILLVMGFTIQNNLTKPVADIANFIKKAKSNSFRSRLHMKECNEIGEISQAINEMLDQIHDTTHNIIQTQSRLYEAEIAQQQAELRSLQSQINPHFLYNTLNCMQGLAYTYNCPEIVTMTGSLSQLLRYSITGNYMVTVSEELECVKGYIELFSIRFGRRYSYSITCEEGLEKAVIMKLLLQPLVENAFQHGLGPVQKGHIAVSVQRETDKTMVILVEDDGVGMEPEKLESLRQLLADQPEDCDHIGILNIAKRIRHICPGNFGVEIESAPGNGTLFRLRLPIRYYN